jgi:hypothetical protein
MFRGSLERRIMTLLRRAVLLACPLMAACQGPTQEEIIEQFSGVRTLHSAGAAPLPFVETLPNSQLAILSGSLTLTAHASASGRHTCSFTLTFRESADAKVVDEGTETAPCEFFRLLNTGIFLQLGDVAWRTRRFENRAECFRDTIACSGSISGHVEKDGSITIIDRGGVEFVFRR